MTRAGWVANWSIQRCTKHLVKIILLLSMYVFLSVYVCLMYISESHSAGYTLHVLLISVSLGVNAIMDLWPYMVSQCSRYKGSSSV